MSDSKDYNILLLRILAHDLLAPLTAVKWQTELLGKAYKDAGKRERYLEGISQSTELGISLAKHAHVASKVLSGAYKGEKSDPTHLSRLIRIATDELMLQYGRHGLTLEVRVEDEKEEKICDAPIISLLVWSVGKYFLSCSPPHTLVAMQGKEASDGGYTFSGTSSNIPNAEVYAKVFESGETEGEEYKQAYLFSVLAKEAASLIGATVSTETNGGDIIVKVQF